MKYKIINGIKCLCDSRGVIMKDAEGADVVVTDEQATKLEEHVDGAPAGADEPKVDEEAVEELKAFFAGMATKEAKDAVKALDLIGGFSKASRKAFSDAFSAEMKASEKGALDVDAIKKGFASVKSAGGKSFEFEVKSLSELSSLTGAVIEPERDPSIIRSPQRKVLIEDLADTGGMSSNKVTWVEVLGESGAPAMTAELATFAEKDYTFAVYEASALKVTVMSKHSTEILEDMPQLVSAVKSMLAEDLNLKVDSELYSGAGTAGLFNGIYTQATAFSAGTLVVALPNKLDVLRSALVQVATAGKGNYQPNAIMLNPIDAGLLDMTKDTNGAYVMPPFTTADRTVIKGVQIIESTLVTAGTFLVGDFRKLHIRNKRGLSIQVATENGTDFEKDILTIRASRRLASYVKTNDSGAFVKGTFSTAITDLTS
jgi:HK97 family phage major capsid protein